MPVDKHGNRADIIMDGDSIIKRMNLGALYEPYINATSRTVRKQLLALRENVKDDNLFYPQAFNLLLEYYAIVSPRFHELATSKEYKGGERDHVDAILKGTLRVYYPTDNPANAVLMIDALRKKFPLDIGPVTYRGRSGNLVTTKKPVLIGSAYLLLLEKTSRDDWSGVASAKRQVFGLMARITNHDKYSAPTRPQPVRLLGESEVRLASAVIGGRTTARLMEMANSPGIHKEAVATILRAEKPTNIDHVIDPTRFASGTARNTVYIQHALETAGARFRTHDESDDTPLVYPPEGGA